MTQKNINTQKDENPILSQVLGILWMKENPFKNIDGDYKMQINSIIKSNSKVKGNKKLALYLIEEVDVSYFDLKRITAVHFTPKQKIKKSKP